METNEISNFLSNTIKDAIKLWKNKNTKESITKETLALLDRDKKTIILKLLGFNNSWGEWELDHCNGRAGNSDIGDKLKDLNSSLIDKWIEEIEFPELEDTYKSKILKDITKNISHKFEDKLYELITNKVNRAAQEVVDNLSIENLANIDALITTEKLIRDIKE